MIDCSKTENYFAEKQRMTKMKKRGLCKIECGKCPLSCSNNGKGEDCTTLEMLYFKEAIAIVQRWSDENPKKTYLSELLRIFPDTPLNDDGTPNSLCPSDLGLDEKAKCGEDGGCIECWNQSILSKK